jgi:hypothetical protein
MLTQLTATLPAETGLAIPASPGDISPEASLEDLNSIKASWVENARGMGYPENAYEVAFWLGQEVLVHPREHVYKIWSSGKVHLLAREYEERYQSADGTRMKVCFLAAYLGDPDYERRNPIDQILLSSKMSQVASWHWNVFCGEVREWDDNYLIPGKWLDVVLAATPRARQVAQQCHQEAIEAERQKMLTQLLVGKEV